MVKSDWLIGVEVQLAAACGDWHEVVSLLEDHGHHSAADIVKDAIESEQVTINEYASTRRTYDDHE